MIGEQLHDINNRETGVTLTNEVIQLKGPGLYEKYMACTRKQHDFYKTYNYLRSL